MSDYWLPSLLVALLLPVSAIIGRIIHKSWLEPGTFFAAAWSWYVLSPILFAPAYTVTPLAVGWVLLNVVVVQLGSFAGGALGNVRPARDDDSERSIQGSLWFARWFMIVGTVLGIVACLAVARSMRAFSALGGSSPAAVATIGAFVEAYKLGEVSVPLPVRVAFLSLSFAAFASGCVVGAKRGFQPKWLLYSPILCALVLTVLMTMKAITIGICVYWMAGYLTAAVATRRKRLLPGGRRLLVVGVLFISVLLVFFSAVQMVRYSSWSATQMFELAGSTMVTYAFGHLAGLSGAMEQEGLLVVEPTYGSRSFQGLHSVLFSSKRSGGVFDKYYQLAPGLNRTGNVVTMFWFLLSDFGPVGALAFTLLLGICGGFCYRFAKSRRLWPLGMLAMFYIVTLWGFATLSFTYNVHIMNCALISGLFIATDYARERRHSRIARSTPSVAYS